MDRLNGKEFGKVNLSLVVQSQVITKTDKITGGCYMELAKSLFYFVLAGLFEIGGGIWYGFG